MNTTLVIRKPLLEHSNIVFQQLWQNPPSRVGGGVKELY